MTASPMTAMSALRVVHQKGKQSEFFKPFAGQETHVGSVAMVLDLGCLGDLDGGT